MAKKIQIFEKTFTSIADARRYIYADVEDEFSYENGRKFEELKEIFTKYCNTQLDNLWHVDPNDIHFFIKKRKITAKTENPKEYTSTKCFWCILKSGNEIPFSIDKALKHIANLEK